MFDIRSSDHGHFADVSLHILTNLPLIPYPQPLAITLLLCFDKYDFQIPHVSNVCVHLGYVTSVVSDSVILWTVPCQTPLSMGFSNKNTGVGCHALLQGIFPTQGSSPCLLCLLHWQVGSLPPVPPRKPPHNCFLSDLFTTITIYLTFTDEIDTFILFLATKWHSIISLKKFH